MTVRTASVIHVASSRGEETRASTIARTRCSTSCASVPDGSSQRCSGGSCLRGCSCSFASSLVALDRLRRHAPRVLGGVEHSTLSLVTLERRRSQLRSAHVRRVATVREELRRFFRDGRIDLVPQPGGFYVARSEILPLVLLTRGFHEGNTGFVRYTASSCAGRI